MLWGASSSSSRSLPGRGLGAKKIAPRSTGTFPTTGPLFVGLLVGVIVIVGALTFFPVSRSDPSSSSCS